MTNADIVRRFENEFKNKGNHSIVDELMTTDFVHHLPFPGLPPGREGMKAVGRLVTGAIQDIAVDIEFVVSEGNLVADRITGWGTATKLEMAGYVVVTVAGAQKSLPRPAGWFSNSSFSRRNRAGDRTRTGDVQLGKRHEANGCVA